MVADMQRLERAARLVMGPVQDAAPEVPARPPASVRWLALPAAAVAALAAAMLFF